MQENSIDIKEFGIITELAYKNYDPNDPVSKIINSEDNSNLQHSYTVVETQDTLLTEDDTSACGFQAMLLIGADGKYVIAFMGD